MDNTTTAWTIARGDLIGPPNTFLELSLFLAAYCCIAVCAIRLLNNYPTTLETRENQVVIGFSGLKGAGKDTSARVLAAYGFKKASFAGILKDVVAAAFNWNREMLEGATVHARAIRKMPDEYWSHVLERPGFTPVRALQLWGTDLVRNHFNTNFWVHSLMGRIDTNQYGSRVAVTDARFKNEADAIRTRGGIVIRVERGPDPEWYTQLKNGTGPEWYTRIEAGELTVEEAHAEYGDEMPHESEWRGVGCEDVIVRNDGTPEELLVQLEYVLKTHKILKSNRVR